MTAPEALYAKWAHLIDPSWRADFASDLEALAAHEQARERRRICSDSSYYRRSCEQTAEEIKQYVAERPRNRSGR